MGWGASLVRAAGRRSAEVLPHDSSSGTQDRTQDRTQDSPLPAPALSLAGITCKGPGACAAQSR